MVPRRVIPKPLSAPNVFAFGLILTALTGAFEYAPCGRGWRSDLVCLRFRTVRPGTVQGLWRLWAGARRRLCLLPWCGGPPRAAALRGRSRSSPGAARAFGSGSVALWPLCRCLCPFGRNATGALSVAWRPGRGRDRSCALSPWYDWQGPWSQPERAKSKNGTRAAAFARSGWWASPRACVCVVLRITALAHEPPCRRSKPGGGDRSKCGLNCYTRARARSLRLIQQDA